MASQQRNLIVLVDYEDDIVIIDPEKDTREKVYIREIHDGKITNANEFCDLLESFLPLERVKAILFIIISTNFQRFNDAQEFRLTCQKFCQKNEIFFVSVPFTCLEAIYAVSQSQTLVNEGEQVLITFSMVPGFPHGFTLLREKDRYRFLKYNRSNKFMFSDEWKKEYFDVFNPKKYILVHQIPNNNRQGEIEMYDDFFEELNAATITQGPDFNLLSKAAAEKVLHLMDEKISKYDVAPPCLNEFFIYIGKDTVMEALLFDDPLPFEKSVIVDVDASKKLLVFVKTDYFGPKELLKEIKLSSFKSKKIKINLKVDVNAIYEFNVDPVGEKTLNEKVSELSLTDSKIDPKTSVSVARIIFSKQTFAVYVKENGIVRGIKNDMDGIPLYIAFTEKKPIVGQSAKELYDKKPESVIFDLIKLCSTSNANIMNPKWAFRFLKENNCLMVNVHTVDGEKNSSVDLLMALILRHAMKIIKNETGKKMNKIEIEFRGFSPNDILKQTFINAGKLMEAEIKFC
uniref:Ku domain-containing protein n=1 Tax=Panagrolaimus sp. ES5 TaxID=591445 RepID=A0AC34FM17_9BILA